MAKEETILMGIEEQKEEEKTELVKEEPKKKPFALWEVGGTSYKLKLDAAGICELEAKYKKNLLELLDEESIPPLATMLTLIQVSMQRWHHGMTYKKVQSLYDEYQESGKTQIDLLKEVVVELYKVSGFFTEEMITEMEEEEEAL